MSMLTGQAEIDDETLRRAGGLQNYVKELTLERDDWKKKFQTLDKELKAELRDPNGTIWEHAAKLQEQADELQRRLDKSVEWLSHSHDRERIMKIIKEK